MAKYKKKAEVIRPTQNVLPPNFKGTDEQEAIVEHAASGESFVIEALAGTGKTVSGVYVAEKTWSRDKSAMAIAFSNTNIDTFQERFADWIQCKTLHSLGYNAIRNHWGVKYLKLENYKYADLIDKYMKENRVEGDAADSFKYDIQEICKFTRVWATNLSNDDEYNRVIDRFGLNPSREAREAAEWCVSIGNLQARDDSIIDFDDMIYLPYRYHMTPPQQDILFVDECQDLNPAQLSLAMSAVKEGGQSIFVGDRNQTIFSFAGSTSDSVDFIIGRVGGKVLPLTLTFRCPQSHIQHVNELYPHIPIKAHESNIQGLIYNATESEVVDLAKAGDWIVCRNNAPLIQVAFKLIRQRKNAKILGKEIGQNITRPLKSIRKRGNFIFARIELAVEQEYEREFKKMQKEGRGKIAFQNLGEKYQCLRICVELFQHDCDTIDELIYSIENLFSDTESEIRLSTIHKAKGREAKTVYILRSNKLPAQWDDQKDWELQAEHNCNYVVRTRSMETMYLSSEDF